MKSIKWNLLANFASNLWVALISFGLLPIYIKFIGIEAYGLVGIYSTLQAMSSLLDMGFTTTMNREMARVSANPEQGQDARNLVRTLETVYWAVGLLLGVTIIALVPILTDHWITTVHLARSTVQIGLILIGVITVFQWPFSFYSGGLMGLQRQVLLSVMQTGMGTLRGIGAILILWLVSPTIQAFFSWQIAIGALSTFFAAFFLWRSLPPSTEVPRFQGEQLRRVWRFAAGVTAISALGLVMTQTDKIVLSRLLTLEKFGYYTLAGVVAASLYLLVNPIYNAIFPRFTKLVTQGNQTSLVRFYHQSAQLMSVILLPVVVVLAFFSKEILFVWTGNLTTATNTYQPVVLLAIGTGLHGIAHVPWALQLAYGWTRLGFYKNLVSVVILVPLTIVLAFRYGAIGGAAMWVALNLGEVLISQRIMHQRLLKGELRRWYFADLGVPLSASVMVALTARLFIHGDYSRAVLLLILIVVSTLTLSATVLAVPSSRSWVVCRLARLRVVSSAGSST